MRRADMLLLARVCEVVEVHALSVPVDPGRDQAEAVEASSNLAVAVAEFECRRLAVHLHRDSPATIGCGGVVLERPFVRFAVWHDPRSIVAAGVALAVAANSVCRVDEKPLAARALNGDS